MTILTKPLAYQKTLSLAGSQELAASNFLTLLAGHHAFNHAIYYLFLKADTFLASTEFQGWTWIDISKSSLGQLLRGTQRQFSEKYLFERRLRSRIFGTKSTMVQFPIFNGLFTLKRSPTIFGSLFSA